MKRIIVLLSMILLLCSCAKHEEPIYCNYCSKPSQIVIPLGFADSFICQNCFEEDDYDLCCECGIAFKQWSDMWKSPYCENCYLKYMWGCAVCNEMFMIDTMVPLDEEGNYYICASCEDFYIFCLLAEPDDFPENLSHEDFLASIMNDINSAELETLPPRTDFFEMVGLPDNG